MRRLVIIAAIVLTGCEEYDYAPEVSPWKPDHEVELPLEGELELEAGFDFFDPNADVVKARMIVRDPTGAAIRYDDCREPGDEEGDDPPCVATLGRDPRSAAVASMAEGFEGVTTATMYVRAAEREPILGLYTLEAWVIDRTQFESERLTTVVTVVAPGS